MHETTIARFSFADTDTDGGYAVNDNQYLFNGKELQDELGLNWHDYGWRNYDASIGRWMNIKQKARREITTNGSEVVNESDETSDNSSGSVPGTPPHDATHRAWHASDEW